MAKFHFTMQDGDHIREADFEIPEKLLIPPPQQIFLKRFDDPKEMLKYRHSVISQHLRKWALSHINLTWREIHHEQDQPSNTNRPDHGTT